jgi:hypothetical protein
MDTRNYPQGKAPFYSKYVLGVLKFFKRSTAAEMLAIDGTAGVVYEVGKAYTKRHRATVAEVNAGATVLAAIPGYKYQIKDAYMIAVGGQVTTVTTVDILGTLSSARKIMAGGQAALAQSALVRAGGTGGTVLADGASFTANDVNTAITVGITGSSITVATHVDFHLTYELVRA